MTGTKDVGKIAADFAAIPWPDHDARLLAEAYLQMQEANQWLRDDVSAKVETIKRLEAGKLCDYRYDPESRCDGVYDGEGRCDQCGRPSPRIQGQERPC